jgi:DNA polymerase-3 subunit alpha
MGRQVSDEGRMKYPTELYLKSPDEMREALGGFDQAIENTARVAAMCDLELNFSKRHSPVYRVPKELLKPKNAEYKNVIPLGVPDDERYLRQLCEDGLKWRYETTDVSPDIRKRLEYELSVIATKHFCSYFLIVWDFCNFARDNGIPVGARGSAVGTMVGYLLGLCNVDPLKYSLLFERFMDPSRNEIPDIDIDICQDGRQKVIEYVRGKYGHVAQIITFGTLAAKAACKDVGRVMGVPLAEIDKLTKLIPSVPGMTLEKAMKQSGEMRELIQSNPTIQKVIDIAKKLEGMCRSAGCHAAGVIIADLPLDEVVPLYRDKDENILTQFEGPIAEKCGLLKMDFLGLRTLTVLTRSIDLEHQTRSLRPKAADQANSPTLDEKGRIDIEKIDLGDANVLKLFQRGETRGIFQFESGGMQDLLMKMQPDRLEDLIAANALYRPGPMELIPTYCNRKHGKEAVPAVHPIMDHILAETYGIMVYQEQVMQIFNQLGGIELSNAYKLIKAISKKTSDVIAKFKPAFLSGAQKNGVSEEKAQEIFELILKFGGYGFNKSHSTRYAIIAFQTAYMKVYHPVEYMSALLTFEIGSTDKVVEYIEECRRMNLPVLPPDISMSDKDFTPVYAVQPGSGKRKKSEAKVEGVIRFGLAAVRGVGEKAVEAIAATRRETGEFTSLYDFCERIDLRTVTRATIDALIKCGAFQSLKARRSQLLAILDRAVEMGQQSQNDRRSGQMSMFAASTSAPTARLIDNVLPDIDELDSAELLKFEKELLGFYITSHPLTEHQTMLERYATASTKEAVLLGDGAEITLCGMINRVKKVMTKNGRSAGKPMAIITMEDLEGQIDGTLFAETFEEVSNKYPGVVANESIVAVRGRVDRKRETPSILVNEVIPISEVVGRLTTAVAVKLDGRMHNAETITALPTILARHKGNLPIYFQVSTPTGKATLQIDRQHTVKASPALVSELEQLLGNGGIELAGAGSKRIKRLEQQRLFKDDIPEPFAAPAGDLSIDMELEDVSV